MVPRRVHCPVPSSALPGSPGVTPASLNGRATLELVSPPALQPCSPPRTAGRDAPREPGRHVRRGRPMNARHGGSRQQMDATLTEFSVASASSVEGRRCRSSCRRLEPRFSRRRARRQRRLSKPARPLKKHELLSVPMRATCDRSGQGGDHRPSWFDVTPDRSARRPPLAGAGQDPRGVVRPPQPRRDRKP